MLNVTANVLLFFVFSVFCIKNAENDFFNQHLGWAAPKRWLKYTTSRGIHYFLSPALKMNKSHVTNCDAFSRNGRHLNRSEMNKSSTVDRPWQGNFMFYELNFSSNGHQLFLTRHKRSLILKLQLRRLSKSERMRNNGTAPSK